MLREFFADFLRLFFPVWAARFDLTNPEWLEQELLPNPPDGERHVLDLVAKLRTTVPLTDEFGETPDSWLALVHVEIEAPDRTARLKPRLPAYWFHLRQRHGLPVLPVVLYLQVGLDGIGVDTVEERIADFPVLSFRYLYVGLPSLDAVEYVRGGNWLGVALSALMKAPRERWPELGLDALQRLWAAPLNDFQRFLLSDCVQAYLPLDEEGRQLFETMTMAAPFSKLVARNKTPYDRGLEEGIEKGIEKGADKSARDIATALLENRFRSLPESLAARLQSMNASQLRDLILRVSSAASLDELFPAP